MDRAVKAALPKIFAKLDRELPRWLFDEKSPEAISGRIAQAISDTTGKTVGAEQVNAIAKLYDPRLAITKAASFLP